MKQIYKNQEGLLEISEIDGSDSGYSIIFLENGKVQLFEETSMNQFNAGIFNSVYDALKVAETWT